MNDANKIAPDPVTAETITVDQLKWMRDNTGWIGPACEHAHRMIHAAIHGDPNARATCAAWLNQRRTRDAFWAALTAPSRETA